MEKGSSILNLRSHVRALRSENNVLFDREPKTLHTVLSKKLKCKLVELVNSRHQIVKPAKKQKSDK